MSEEEFKGIFGESLTERLLSEHIPIYKKILRDICITLDNKKTQIDNILITAKGIYVIENKNFSGLVISNDKKNGIII